MSCPRCSEDANWLRLQQRPADCHSGSRLRVVDLFSGGGGLSLGIAEAARRAGLGTDVPLAVDAESVVADPYASLFPEAGFMVADVAALLPGSAGEKLARVERALIERVGTIDVLVGGPPCQGHSDLNNRTRRRDPRNALYVRMARAAEVLEPSVVLIENVPGVRRDRGGAVACTTVALERCGYRVAERVINLQDVGVPQRRRRHLLLAIVSTAQVDPAALLTALRPCCPAAGERTVRWAIEELADYIGTDPFDAPGRVALDNQRRMELLFREDLYDLPDDERPPCHRDGGHTYRSMYGRLKWDSPAQTITTGFGSMGQGRYVHPGRRRTITAHEAARLQTLPDFLDLRNIGTRKHQARIIGNAVPPLLSRAVGELLVGAGVIGDVEKSKGDLRVAA